MITRRSLLGSAGAAGLLALAPALPAPAAASATTWKRRTSANGWPIRLDAITRFRVEGSRTSVDLHAGDAAVVLLHLARRSHYEIAPIDTGEGGGVVSHTRDRTVRAAFESNHLSGTALALRRTAYPLGGSETLWPHQVEIVRDILLDCEGTVALGRGPESGAGLALPHRGPSRGRCPGPRGGEAGHRQAHRPAQGADGRHGGRPGDPGPAEKGEGRAALALTGAPPTSTTALQRGPRTNADTAEAQVRRPKAYRVSDRNSRELSTIFIR